MTIKTNSQTLDVNRLNPLKFNSLILVLIAFAVWVLMAATIFYQALQWPYLGAEFSADIPDHAFIIKKITRDSPVDASGLQVGDKVIAMINPQSGERYKLTGLEAIEGRHQLHSYDMVTGANQAIRKAWQFISLKSVVFETADGKNHLII